MRMLREGALKLVYYSNNQIGLHIYRADRTKE